MADLSQDPRKTCTRVIPPRDTHYALAALLPPFPDPDLNPFARSRMATRFEAYVRGQSNEVEPPMTTWNVETAYFNHLMYQWFQTDVELRRYPIEEMVARKYWPPKDFFKTVDDKKEGPNGKSIAKKTPRKYTKRTLKNSPKDWPRNTPKVSPKKSSLLNGIIPGMPVKVEVGAQMSLSGMQPNPNKRVKLSQPATAVPFVPGMNKKTNIEQEDRIKMENMEPEMGLDIMPIGSDNRDPHRLPPLLRDEALREMGRLPAGEAGTFATPLANDRLLRSLPARRQMLVEALNIARIGVATKLGMSNPHHYKFDSDSLLPTLPLLQCEYEYVSVTMETPIVKKYLEKRNQGKWVVAPELTPNVEGGCWGNPLERDWGRRMYPDEIVVCWGGWCALWFDGNRWEVLNPKELMDEKKRKFTLENGWRKQLT